MFFFKKREKNKLCYQNEGSFNKRKNKLCYLCGSKEGYSISVIYVQFSDKKKKTLK